MKKTHKTESSRLNLFYIIQVLKKYSDEENPLSISEIGEKVNKEFGYLTTSDSLISMDTVKRTLEELTDRIFPADAYLTDAPYQHGYWIFCVMKKESSYVPYRVTEGKVPPKRYYYYDHDLTEAEIQMLKNAVETYSYFSEDDITDIVTKLIHLRPRSFPRQKYYDVAKEERDEDSLLLMNIDMLNEIIQRRNGANIVYGAYDTDMQLKARPGYPRYIEPLHLIWSNGFYYLLAYNEKYQSTISYRIDKIIDIEEVEIENTYRVENFNPVQYRHEHPVMYSGKKEKLVLLCRDTGKNYIMNTVIDTFGKKIKVTKADKELIKTYLPHSAEFYEEQNITWLRVAVETTTGGAELWATQHCNDCVIISPEESVNRVRERLKTGMELYRS